jgi:hypothetical protein
MEDSESTSNSFSDDDGEGLQDLDFNSDILSHTGSSRTTPGSNFTQHTASSIDTPGSYFHSHNAPPNVTSQNFPLTENEFTPSLHTIQDSNDVFSSTSGTFLHQNNNDLALDNQTPDLSMLWGMAYAASPAQKGNDAMMAGPEMVQGQHGSTLILEDVQPQMVTKIINMLYESKSVVKMKIVSQQ